MKKSRKAFAWGVIALALWIIAGEVWPESMPRPAEVARSLIAAGTANRLLYNASGTGLVSDLPAITANRVLISDANGLPTQNAALTANRVLLSDASGFPTQNAALTASRALASDASGFPASTSVTSTELGYLSGVTSALQTQIDAITAAMGSLGTAAAEQLLVNGGFRIWQDGPARTSVSTYPNNDDTYMADQWILESDGNDIVDVSRDTTTTPTTSQYSMLLDVETGNKKFGIFQVVETERTYNLRGQNVSLSFQARITGSSIGAIRAALVIWTGTANAVTSDIISAWNGAGSNPTLVASWAFVGTPGALTAPTTSFQTYEIEGLAVPSNANNIGVFIWVDDVTLTVGDFLYIAEVSLVRGSNAVAFYTNAPSVQANLLQCQRFYSKTQELDTAPSGGAGDYVGSLGGRGDAGTTFEPTVNWRYPVTMRTAPTITLYNPRVSGTAGQWNCGAGDSSSARSIYNSSSGVQIDHSGGGVATIGQCWIQAKADARL